VVTLARMGARIVLIARDETRADATLAHLRDNAPGTVGGQLSLRWTESGGPTTTPPTHRGCGTSIIENMIKGQRGG
jgi:hypothetical protein